MDGFLLELDYLQVISVAKSDGNPLCDFGNTLKGVVREANSLNLYGFSDVLRGECPCTCFSKNDYLLKVICSLERGCSPINVNQTTCVDLPIPVL